MARQRQVAVDSADSQRWPSAFANVEACQSLVNHPGWKLVVADLRELHQRYQYKIAHEVPLTAVKASEQNFERGRLAGWEWVMEFEEELREWKEQHK